MADSKQKDDDRYSDEETKRRMDDALKRALNTSPKPHKGKNKNDGLSVERTRNQRGEESDDD